MSRTQRAIAITLAVLALLVGLAAPATALPDFGCPPGVPDSKVAPSPQVPGRGLTGTLLVAPAEPTTADPFADGSDTSIYEAYGLAGLRWNTYDLGCGGSAANPGAAADTSVANLLFTTVPIGVTAVAGALASTVYDPTWLAVFDDPLRELSLGLRDAFYTPLAPFALLVAGITLMWSARRARFGTAATSLLLIGVAIGIVSVATAVPTRLGSAADTAMTSSTGYINASLSGREEAAANPEVESIAPFVDNVLYPRWVAGTLGDSDSSTAQTYGPDLFRASAFTWAEAAEAEGNPDRAREIVEAKQQLWTQTAEAVKEADPDAYEYLTGARQNRFGEATASTLAVGVLIFPIAAFLLMVTGYVLIRLTVMTAPVWATFAMLPNMSGILSGAGKLLLAAIINPVVAAVGATLTINVTTLLIAPDSPVPLWLGLILALIVCVLAWVALKPFRRIWALVTGNPLARAGQQLKDDAGAAGRLASGAVKFAAKTKFASEVVSDDVADELVDRANGQQPYRRGPLPAERFVRESPQVITDDTGLRVADGTSLPAATAASMAAESRGLPAPPLTGVDEPLLPPISHDTPIGQTVSPADAASTEARLGAAPALTEGGGAAAGPAPHTRRVEPTVNNDGEEVYVLFDYAADGLRVDDDTTAGAGRA